MALIVPTIYADTVRAKYTGKVVIRNLAQDMGYLEGTIVGGTVTFPVFGTITDAEDMTAGGFDELTPVSLAQTSDYATVKQLGKAVFVKDYDNLTALGNHVDEAATQTGIVIARGVDLDLLADAASTSLVTHTVAKLAITPTELDAGLALFGDEQDTEEMAGIVIHSKLIASFYDMDEFVDVNKTYNIGAPNGFMQRGIIGYYRHIPVYVSDKGITWKTANSSCTSFIVKIGALGYMEKREIVVEEERKPRKGGSNIVSNLIYATKLVKADGVVMIDNIL